MTARLRMLDQSFRWRVVWTQQKNIKKDMARSYSQQITNSSTDHAKLSKFYFHLLYPDFGKAFSTDDSKQLRIQENLIT